MPDDKLTPPHELPPNHTSRLATKLTLSELETLTPEIRKELVSEHGLEVRIVSRSSRVQELLERAGIAAVPTEATYDKVYDRSNPGYDRVYDRG
jgi:hypothetical protein